MAADFRNLTVANYAKYSVFQFLCGIELALLVEGLARILLFTFLKVGPFWFEP
jgi:uncharacterized protein YqhQ